MKLPLVMSTVFNTVTQLQFHCWSRIVSLYFYDCISSSSNYNNGQSALQQWSQPIVTEECRYCCRTRWSWRRPLVTCCCARAATPRTRTTTNTTSTTRTRTGSSWAGTPTRSRPPDPAPSGRSAEAARSAPCTRPSPPSRHYRTWRPGENSRPCRLYPPPLNNTHN